MTGAQIFDRWLTKNVKNVAKWSRTHGLDPSYVCHLRRGRKSPSMQTAALLARVAKVPMLSWVA